MDTKTDTKLRNEAIAAFGEDHVYEAFIAFNKWVRSGENGTKLYLRRIQRAKNPYKAMVDWHNSQLTDKLNRFVESRLMNMSRDETRRFFESIRQANATKRIRGKIDSLMDIR